MGKLWHAHVYDDKPVDVGSPTQEQTNVGELERQFREAMVQKNYWTRQAAAARISYLGDRAELDRAKQSDVPNYILRAHATQCRVSWWRYKRYCEQELAFESTAASIEERKVSLQQSHMLEQTDIAGSESPVDQEFKQRLEAGAQTNRQQVEKDIATLRGNLNKYTAELDEDLELILGTKSEDRVDLPQADHVPKVNEAPSVGEEQPPGDRPASHRLAEQRYRMEQQQKREVYQLRTKYEEELNRKLEEQQHLLAQEHQQAATALKVQYHNELDIRMAEQEHRLSGEHQRQTTHLKDLIDTLEKQQGLSAEKHGHEMAQLLEQQGELTDKLHLLQSESNDITGSLAHLGTQLEQLLQSQGPIVAQGEVSSGSLEHDPRRVLQALEVLLTRLIQEGDSQKRPPDPAVQQAIEEAREAVRVTYPNFADRVVPHAIIQYCTELLDRESRTAGETRALEQFIQGLVAKVRELYQLK
jgi:hypothetical protein